MLVSRTRDDTVHSPYSFVTSLKVIGCLPRNASRMSQTLETPAQKGPGTCDSRCHIQTAYVMYNANKAPNTAAISSMFSSDITVFEKEFRGTRLLTVSCCLSLEMRVRRRDELANAMPLSCPSSSDTEMDDRLRRVNLEQPIGKRGGLRWSPCDVCWRTTRSYSSSYPRLLS
jgi:hypothetical protein